MHSPLRTFGAAVVVFALAFSTPAFAQQRGRATPNPGARPPGNVPAKPTTPPVDTAANIKAAQDVLTASISEAKAGTEDAFLKHFDATDASLIKGILDKEKQLKDKSDALVKLVQDKLGIDASAAQIETGPKSFLEGYGAASIDDYTFMASGPNAVIATEKKAQTKTNFSKIGSEWKMTLDAKQRSVLQAMAGVQGAAFRFYDTMTKGINDGSITKDNYTDKAKESATQILAPALAKLAVAMGTAPAPAPAEDTTVTPAETPATPAETPAPAAVPAETSATAPAEPAVAAPAASAPAVEADAGDAKLRENWESFLHYVLMGRPEIAKSYGEAVINSGARPQDVYMLFISTDRGGVTLARAKAANKDLGPIVDKLNEIINEGALAVRSDPTEIGRWIEMLAGSPQEFTIARDRLMQAGQYAVPQLISTLTDLKTSAMLRDRITTIMPNLGKEAVRPLTEALTVKDAAVRQVVCRALGKIGYKHAAPYLKQLLEQGDLTPELRIAAEGALSAIDKNALTKPASELFYELAVKYYDHDESVNSDARYNTGNVWYWKEGSGLTYIPVPAAIFNDVYAMRTSRDCLDLDAKYSPAVSLWLSAYIRKTMNLPTGASDPTQVEGEPGATFYARASGSKYMQAVLARALKDKDQKVALAAIQALAVTAGAENLVTPVEGGAQPLVSALSFPSREVRYLAAETLVNAKPQKRFNGWNQVVPVLVEALRQTGGQAVMLADPDETQRNAVKGYLRAAGMEVYDAESAGKALEAARAAAGVDVVILSSNITGPGLGEAFITIRGTAQFSRLPILVIAPNRDAAASASKAVQAETLVNVISGEGLDGAKLMAAVDELKAKASSEGNLPADQAVDWAIRAANAFRSLAETKNPVFDLTDATTALITALKDKRDNVRVASAWALAQINNAAGQQALEELADGADVAEPVRLDAYAALSASVRQFGNELGDKQIKAIRDAVSAKGSVPIRDAAAQVLGALSLPSDMIKDLIVSSPSVQPK